MCMRWKHGTSFTCLISLKHRGGQFSLIGIYLVILFCNQIVGGYSLGDRSTLIWRVAFKGRGNTVFKENKQLRALIMLSQGKQPLLHFKLIEFRTGLYLYFPFSEVPPDRNDCLLREKGRDIPGKIFWR